MSAAGVLETVVLQKKAAIISGEKIAATSMFCLVGKLLQHYPHAVNLSNPTPSFTLASEFILISPEGERTCLNFC
jgi:hypothetical protein